VAIVGSGTATAIANGYLPWATLEEATGSTGPRGQVLFGDAPGGGGG
jgi:hypothetical protein